MYCSNCGNANAAGATHCASCGNPLLAGIAPPPLVREAVPNQLVWAILATLLCCLPTGIVAIVYAAQVDGKVAIGDIDGAKQASANAKLWSWISLGIGLAFLLGYAALVVISIIAES